MNPDFTSGLFHLKIQDVVNIWTNQIIKAIIMDPGMVQSWL